MDHGALSFLHKPFFAIDVNRTLHAAFGLKMPELSLSQDDDEDHLMSQMLCPTDARDPDVEDWGRAVQELDRPDEAERTAASKAAPDGGKTTVKTTPATDSGH